MVPGAPPAAPGTRMFHPEGLCYRVQNFLSWCLLNQYIKLRLVFLMQKTSVVSSPNLPPVRVTWEEQALTPISAEITFCCIPSPLRGSQLLCEVFFSAFYQSGAAAPGHIFCHVCAFSPGCTALRACSFVPSLASRCSRWGGTSSSVHPLARVDSISVWTREQRENIHKSKHQTRLLESMVSIAGYNKTKNLSYNMF